MKRLMSSMDKPLLIASISMLIFGLLMIFSSSNAMATVNFNGNPYHFLLKQGVFLITGLIMFAFLIKRSTKSYYKISIAVLIVLIVALIGLDIIGATTRSSRSWINVFDIASLQPSEFFKMAIIMYMATYYEKIISRNKNDFKLAILPLAVGMFGVLLTSIQPDLGTALIILGIIIITFVSIPLEAPIKKRILRIGSILILLMTFLVLALFLSGQALLASKLDRFNILEPCTRYQEPSGYQVCNGFIAINNGGLTGVGLGNSTQKYLYLPEAHTDFIFPVIVEEWGLIGSLFVLLVLFFIIYRIILIARRSTSLRGSILAYGVAVYLVLHISINLTGALGLAPLTGIPLPFLSYGGSSLWTLIIGLTIVQRVEIERKERIRQNILQKSINM